MSALPAGQNTPTEEWRHIAGLEGQYAVSNRGRVRSLHRIIERRDGRRLRWPAKDLELTPATDGRLRVLIGGRTRYVHHLVLEAFVGPRPPGAEGCHEDDDCTNNWVGNLRWGTPASNVADKVRNRVGKRDICARGHRRVHPNLSKTNACLACLRAVESSYRSCNRLRYQALGKEAFIQQEADRIYATILIEP